MSGNLLYGSISANFGSCGLLHTLYEPRRRVEGCACLRLGGRSHGARNLLAGTLPPELGRLNQSLTDMWGWGGSVAARALCWRLPSCSSFAQNNLTGVIPDAYAALSNLIALNVSNNALSGTIPNALGLLKDLTLLCVRHVTFVCVCVCV